MGRRFGGRQTCATIRAAFSKVVQAFVEHPRRIGAGKELLTEALKLSQGGGG
jgi:hypothetical protein